MLPKSRESRFFTQSPLIKAVAALLCLFVCFPVWAEQQDTEHVLMSATYEGKISGWNVELERTLTQYPDGRYQLRSHADKVFASLDESSFFTIQNGKMLPQEYVYKRSIFGKKSVERIIFDWRNSRAIYTRSDRKQNNIEHLLKPGLLDPTLYQLAIQADLAKGQDRLGYQFIKRKSIVEYHLQTNKKEAVIFKNKQFDAASVSRNDPETNKTTKVWVIPALNFMISNIQYVEKNEEYTIALTEYSADPERLNQFYQSFSNNSSSR